ncbi:Uncharacterised protein [Mycobacterium tuberculosis]|uniref:Uncharacterized protein n=1 Tax=Mycobacterium tuberculosis TaxID=1773 RepID=A0A654TLN9_MYCTX|nr:hypothetical protein GS11_3086 [Mycobacterium tuberculosis variant bovis BCG]EQM20391.1 hypothetical protein FJ05194_2176 [Mycobacterium tuberculosis FJ05194]KAF3386049.1 hypothetical protein BIT18_3768 [Mycobacterium tuberculosis variant bovis]CFE50759.1 Uncharacterised protein [Mycobacterium tuberculosis]BAQ07096.1 hypothetical protein KURONO_3314 [Mycobacterium tuberculosis str. Kurono]
MNPLLDDLHDHLIVSDNVENPSEGAISCYQYSKVTIELSDLLIR